MAGEIMKTIVKRLARDEKGAALVMVLILLLISGLIIGPLLSYMGTGLITGEVYETRTAELYAADAGVEDAVWRIQNQVGQLPCNPSMVWSYNITDADGGVAEVNDKHVEVTIIYVDGQTYRVLSTATGDGSGTQIEAYVTGVGADYSGILDNVITSRIDYRLQGPSIVDPPEGEEHGPVANYLGAWPEADDLSDWYLQDVGNATHYYSDTTIDLNGVDMELGPLYVDGELDIVNSSNTPATLTLTGTLYITGDTQIYGPTSNDPLKLTLDLNGQTIFVASNHTHENDSKYALEIQKCNIIGSGCIIAVGDIQFKPKLLSSPTDYILVMSLMGKTYMQPNGDFYGTLAGSSEVWIQNGEAHWTDYSNVEGGLNFPGFPGVQQLVYSIYSWEVIPLWRE